MRALLLTILFATACEKSAATTASPCEDACTKLSECQDRVFKGEWKADKPTCLRDCNTMPAAERVKWSADVVDAERTNKCDRLFEDDTLQSPEEAPPPDNDNCVALPALSADEVKSQDLDLDGDGLKDVRIGPAPSDCGSLECVHALYVARAGCFEHVGNVDHVPQVLKTKHHGLFDVKTSVRLDGETEETTYRFNGKKYVASR